MLTKCSQCKALLSRLVEDNMLVQGLFQGGLAFPYEVALWIYICTTPTAVFAPFNPLTTNGIYIYARTHFWTQTAYVYGQMTIHGACLLQSRRSLIIIHGSCTLTSLAAAVACRRQSAVWARKPSLCLALYFAPATQPNPFLINGSSSEVLLECYTVNVGASYARGWWWARTSSKGTWMMIIW